MMYILFMPVSPEANKDASFLKKQAMQVIEIWLSVSGIKSIKSFQPLKVKAKLWNIYIILFQSTPFSKWQKQFAHTHANIALNSQE